MTNEIDIVINSTDKTGKGFSSVKKSVKEVGKSAEDAGDSVQDLGRKATKSGKGVEELGKDSKKSSGKVDDLGKEAGKTERKIKSLGSSGSAEITKLAVAITAAEQGMSALGNSITEGIDLAKGTNDVAAKVGLNDAEAKRVGKIQGELYANAYGESVDELTESTSTAIRALGGDLDSITDGELKNFSTNMMNFTSAFERGFEETGDAVRGMITNDLVASSEEAMDVLTRGMQIDPSGDILDTFREYGTELKQMGISAEEFLSMADAGLKAGARNTDLMADGIKEANIIIQEGTEDSKEALKALGLNADEMQAAIAKGGPSAKAAFGEILDALSEVDDEVLKNKLSVALLGTKFEDVSGDVIDAMADASGSVEGLDDASEHLDKTINDNVGVSMTVLKRKISSGLAPVVKRLADFLIQDLAPALSAIFRWLNENRTAVKAAAIGISVALLPAFIAWAVAAGAAAVATLAAAAPVIALGVAVAGLAFLVMKYWDDIVEATKTAWRIVELTLSIAWKMAKLIVSEAIDFIWGIIKGGVDLIMGVWDGISTAVSSVFGKVKDVIGSAMQWVYDNTIGKIEDLIGKLNGLKNKIAGVFGGGEVSAATPSKNSYGSRLSRFATGGTSSGGIAIVGEAGPEIVELSAGDRVRSNSTPAFEEAGGFSGDVHIHVSGSIMSERDLEGVVKRALQSGGFAGLI